MIVAGSVLALLLMGLAVDGFVNPADEEPEESDIDSGADDEFSDQSGNGNGLTNLLMAGSENDSEDDDEDTGDARYTPLDEIEPDAEDTPSSLDDEADEEDENLAAAESSADSVWLQTEAEGSAADFLEIDATAEMESGEDVAYVEAFDPATDTLVLEFDGTAADAPEIDVEYDPDDDSTLILANGLPVTMVEGGEDITVDHIRVVMGGDESGLEPQVLPADKGADETSGPLTQNLPEKDDLANDGPHTLPPSEAKDDIDTTGPQTQLLPDVTDDLVEDVTDPLEDVTDPLEDLVETAEDLLPDDTTINAILDQVTGDMTGAGGVDEMLSARVDMDDAFGRGGEDAQTGTFNDDLVTGGDGQDALFGDEGNDTLMAGAGNDELYGDSGDDELHGEAGVDFLDGGEGDDILDGGAGRDLLFGGEGDDVLYGGAANDFLQGGQGADTLDGGSGDDTLDGLYGDGGTDTDDGDVLWGGDGDDRIILGHGDMAHGGEGADTFVSGSYIENAEFAGHVADFNPSEDRIEVIFDPQENPDPMLEVLDFADGSGADIILNGEVILSVAGAQGLDPNMIQLQAMA